MNRKTVADGIRQRARSTLSPGFILGRGWRVVALLAVLLAIGGGPASPVLAASFDVRTKEQYVFSVGYVDRVTANTLTLRFDDGATETYTLNGQTAIQSQNGDVRRLADLEIGEMVIVLTVENDSLAVTVVSSGPEGFHDAGPADIRGHERECGECDAHAPEANDDDGTAH